MLSTTLAIAQTTIDFETVPGAGQPTEGMLIHDEYEQDFGVTFELRNLDGSSPDPKVGPKIARVGHPRTAYGSAFAKDTACDDLDGVTGDDLVVDEDHNGCFFLTDDGEHPSPDPFSLRIVYSTPVQQASGELLDVDRGPESWRIEAKDANGNLIAHPENPIKIAHSDQDTGDSRPTRWSFDFTSRGAEIHIIDLVYTGDASFGRGLAFDNFSPASLGRSLEVGVDIKPQSCPNPLNVDSGGVLPVAITGTEDLDVSEIDPKSITLVAEDGPGAIRWSFEDVATPFEPFTDKKKWADKNGIDPCEACTSEGEDGITDLTLKFDKQEVVEALGDVEDGDCVTVELHGKLKESEGGTPIIGEDIVKILDKGAVIIDSQRGGGSGGPGGPGGRP